MTIDGNITEFTIARLGSAQARDYRDLRLDGLARHPEAFGASWEDEAARTVEQFAERLGQGTVFGARSEGRPGLIGAVGLRVPQGEKTRHKGIVWGMYVRPQARRIGVGEALLAHALDHAATLVEEVILTVEASNRAALDLYRRAGFEQYGLEKRALKIGEDYRDEALMALVLAPPRTGEDGRPHAARAAEAT